MSEHTRGHTPGERVVGNWMGRWHVTDADGRSVAEANPAWDQATVYANTRLIAAAPDLLSELERLVERFHRAVMAHGSDEWAADAAVESARAAISRARGSERGQESEPEA